MKRLPSAKDWFRILSQPRFHPAVPRAGTPRIFAETVGAIPTKRRRAGRHCVVMRGRLNGLPKGVCIIRDCGARFRGVQVQRLLRSGAAGFDHGSLAKFRGVQWQGLCRCSCPQEFFVDISPAAPRCFENFKKHLIFVKISIKMDTIVIKLNQPNKAKLLIEMLKSMDFISTVEHFDKYIKAKKLFEEVNKIAANSPLAQMTAAEIDEEIRQYRHGK
jgi:hypothetical protein